jgi:hypothetical protein
VLELGRSWIEGTFLQQNELHEFGKEQEETEFNEFVRI